MKKVRGNKIKTAGGWRIVPHWESGEKEVRVGDEELDIGHVVTAGFREIRSIKKLAK